LNNIKVKIYIHVILPVKREEATGDCKKLHNDEPHVVYSLSVVQVIKSQEMEVTAFQT
jgi:hypothetical protein